jgi:uncharacterized protein (UPF0276 family)
MHSNHLIGVGLRHDHYKDVLEQKPTIGWFEIHPENYFKRVGYGFDCVTEIRKDYSLSLHGVGLSLGSAQGIDPLHLQRLKALVEQLDPFLVSEHLSWSRVQGAYVPDLIPVPYNEESLRVFSENIQRTQEFLGREILIENPSSYLEYHASNMEEIDFMVTLCKRTGAKMLLDVNNVFVSCFNHGWDAKKYLSSIPRGFVKEIHLAGHTLETLQDNEMIRIDTHDQVVCDEVWELFGYAIEQLGPIPTLLEWDDKLPELPRLVSEALKARAYLSNKERVDACA